MSKKTHLYTLKRPNMKQLILAAIALLIMASTCKRTQEECPPDLICTMIFKSIHVQLQYESGSPVILTKASLSAPHLSAPLNPLEEPLSEGHYMLVNDGHMNILSHQKSKEFLFEGWVDDKLVVSQNYLLRHDCCHVELVEGPTELVLPDPSE